MSKLIKSKDYAGEMMTLVDEKTFAPIREGSQVVLRDGDKHVVTGGRAPHKPESSGKVWTTHETWQGEYYPSVIGAKWMHDDALKAHRDAKRVADAQGDVIADMIGFPRRKR